MEMDRRTTLILLGAGVLASRLDAAQHHLHGLKKDPGAYKLQFFTEAENALIDRAAEMILPADDHSPGAHEARASYYIDLVVAHSREATQRQWRERLRAFDLLARDQHGKPFTELGGPEQAAVMHSAAAGEKRPATPAEHFFADMKSMTLKAYYSSELGLLRELGYKGNQARASFPGCQHPAGTHA